MHRDHSSNDLLDGSVAGLLGGGTIVVLFLVFDTLLFTPLATPDFLAQGLLGRADLAAELSARLRIVRIGMFTGLHLFTFTALGIGLAVFFRMSGVRKTLLLGGLYGLTACTLLFRAGLDLSGTELLVTPQWPAVILGNLLAGIVMVFYLRVRTPEQG